ncbi:E3 ubiquitin-protein ligase FANCL isoform X1 [Aplysia californica]|uniref:E3 ubiquitin-protein ligase FANCL isoform X1 n=2 Tax=Aplysia californica TaxID=6500 RepID=A0ABM0JNG8_APLCA|nr:E3 ubiquitin-protein ligase FANCL isoform X1 [Aplysia californica]
MPYEEFIPGLVPMFSEKSLCITYKGFQEICVRRSRRGLKGKPYYMAIHVPEVLSKARIECEWKLEHRIRDKSDLIRQRLQSSSSLATFLKEFILIAETCMQHVHSDAMWSDWNEEIVEQVLEIDSNKLLSIDEDFSAVQIGITDEGGRLHKIKIHLKTQSTTAVPVCITDLPHKLEFNWATNTRLKHVVEQFEATVLSYQNFWNTLKEIDEKCWVLEPEHPSFSATHRRIALGQNLSLHITVNCQQPSTLPECRFLGAESATAPLREKLNVNLLRWDVERSLLNNLQEVLDFDFPSPADTSRTELSMDCGICYCLHLNEEVPNVVCEDKRCAQAFHQSCLYEWLRSLSSRQSFNTIFGECPFCSHPIRVKMPAS